MHERRANQRQRVIGALALTSLVAIVVASISPAGAATRHRHRRDHRPQLSRADSQPGVSETGIEAARRKRKTASQNWSGYAASGGQFTSISGSWTVPAVDCSSTPKGIVATWIGIDGAGSHTVQQTGTFSRCDQGTASYSAWYEGFPAPSIALPNPVGAGDVITAKVTNTGPQLFELVLTNQTRGWTSTNTVRVRGRLASAEAIAEAPSVGGLIVPLANFGTVGFSNVTVNGAPLASAPGVVPVTMVSASGVVKAAPGPLSGGSFIVNWRHT